MNVHLKRGTIFAIIGVICAVLGAGLLYCGVELLGLHKNLAFSVQLILMVQVNFLLNAAFTWKGNVTRKNLWSKLMRHHVIRLSSIALNQAIFMMLAGLLSYMVAYVVGIVLAAGVNYILSSKFVFSPAHSPVRT